MCVFYACLFFSTHFLKDFGNRTHTLLLINKGKTDGKVNCYLFFFGKKCRKLILLYATTSYTELRHCAWGGGDFF